MRINLEMAPADAIVKMADGNPGAVHVMCELLKPDLIEGFLDICRFDDLELYGPDIWVAYKDICGSDIKVLRDRLGHHYHKLQKDVQRLHREGRA